MRCFSRCLFLVLPALLLGGCSREPTQDDMENAMTRLIEETIEGFRQATNRQGFSRGFDGFDSFEKLGCTQPANKRGYDCEFRYSGNLGGALGAVPANSNTLTARFQQTERGWVAEMGLSDSK